jgi:hypothetical protein
MTPGRRRVGSHVVALAREPAFTLVLLAADHWDPAGLDEAFSANRCRPLDVSSLIRGMIDWQAWSGPVPGSG